MTTSTSGARHRADGRPVTALDDLVSSATGGLATATRRTVVVAAAGGLVFSMAGPASAAPTESVSAVGAVDVSGLTAQARAALAASAQVTVPAAVSWGFAAPEFTVEAKPEPAPVVRAAATTVARTEVREEAAPAPASSPVPQAVAGNAVLEIAARYVGVPYVAGGKGPDGFDCSGFTSFVYAQLGIAISSSSADQRWVGTEVSAADALPGDIIWSPGHVGIYAGDGQQIDAPRPGKTVQFRGIWQSNPIYIRVG